MTRTAIFIAALLLSAAPAVLAETESDLFLVEVIVFTHTGADPRPRAVDTLPNYSNAVDVLRERERKAGQPRDLSRRHTVPDQYEAEGSLSVGMDGVWRRLEQSGQYRPLFWRGWYQHTVPNRRTRPVLIHDDTLLHAGDDMHFGRQTHRLEGTVRHTRDRFHRLALDIAWHDAEGDELRAERLNQSRAVRPGRLEYFDGPRLAALVLVTRWESPVESVH